MAAAAVGAQVELPITEMNTAFTAKGHRLEELLDLAAMAETQARQLDLLESQGLMLVLNRPAGEAEPVVAVAVVAEPEAQLEALVELVEMGLKDQMEF
jgi:hypothetical protein